MVGRALSQTKQRQIQVEMTEEWYQFAANLYKMGQTGEGKKKSFRTVCEEAQKECWVKTKKRVWLKKDTLRRRMEGKPSISAFNARKAWLTPQEEEKAKSEKRQAGWLKPKMPALEPPIPRPVKPTDVPDGEDDEGEDDLEGSDGDD